MPVNCCQPEPITLAELLQDQINLRQKETSQFRSPRRSSYAPNAAVLAGEDPGAKSTNQPAADPFEAGSAGRVRGSAEGQANRRSASENPGTTSKDIMAQRLTPSASQSNRNSAPRSRESTEKQRPADGIDHTGSDRARRNPVGGEQASDDHASGGQAGIPGGGSRSEGALPADGEWAEQIREKDELISTLKRQLTALGEQPIEEVVSLEVTTFRKFAVPNSRKG